MTGPAPGPIAERPAMAEYGVADGPDGLLPWSWAEERLVRNRNYWLVTASATGRPHALPVWGIWRAGRGEFWFSCSPNARKARNLAANPRAVVTVDDTVEVVSVEGVASPADGPAEVDAFVRTYLDKYFQPEQFAEMEAFLRSQAVHRIVPERAFGVIEREEEFSQRATRWRWTDGAEFSRPRR